MKLIQFSLRFLLIICLGLVLAGCEVSDDGNSTTVSVDSSVDAPDQTASTQGSSSQSSSSSSASDVTINYGN